MSDGKKTGPKSDIMTVREVAAYLNCHYSTIYRLLGNGALPAFRLGTDWRFRRADIERWISASEPKSEPAPRTRAQAPAQRPGKPRPKG